jgi:SAM-dependent methyltransferase
MQYTGERLVPKTGLGNIEEHLTLYKKSSELIKDSDWVLDIACGSGWGSLLLAEKAKAVQGVDISQEAVEYARREYKAPNLYFLQGSILEIPFPEGTFDIVNSIETFEHVKRFEAEKMISECHRVLKPGGLYVFSTPDGDFFPYKPKTQEEYIGFHFWHYSKNELDAILWQFSQITYDKISQASHFVICKK